MIALSTLFFLTALLYASVGFGGGSTYNALLALYGVDYRLLPVISLVCNVIVVTGGTWRFSRSGQIGWRRSWPLFALSVPMAWAGGKIPISERLFLGLLGVALLMAGLCLFLRPHADIQPKAEKHAGWKEALLGGALGFLAGMTGIGGGIFLSPCLYLLRWGRAKAIAGTCAAFILVNSLAGLIGQSMKQNSLNAFQPLGYYWLLFIGVAIGGQIGSHLGSGLLPERLLRTLTGVLVIAVALRLLWRVHELAA